MDEGQAPPPYNPAQQEPQYPPTSQPYYPPTSQYPNAPPAAQPQYPPTSQPQYPPTSQPYYPPTSQPQYPPTSQPGYGYPPASGKYPEPPPGYTSQQPMPQQHNMTTNSTTVVMTGGVAPQPQYIAQQAPPNYMALSWIVCLFCCWPIGIAAIMASSRVDSAVAVGNYAEAQHQSSRAKGLAIGGLVCGIIIIVIVVIRFTIIVNSNSYK